MLANCGEEVLKEKSSSKPLEKKEVLKEEKGKKKVEQAKDKKAVHFKDKNKEHEKERELKHIEKEYEYEVNKKKILFKTIIIYSSSIIKRIINYPCIYIYYLF